MRTLDRYFFNQLKGPVLGAVGALIMIGLLSQSLSQFDLIIEHGQGIETFLWVTLLSLPQLAGLLFPLSLFVGLLIALTRLHGEHEFVAAFASGLSLQKAAGPAIRMGVWFTLFALMSTLFLQPWTGQAMREELFRVKNDLLSSTVKEGQFSTSKTNLTIYVQRIEQNGLLRQIFIRTADEQGRDRTYSAREGRLVTEGASKILVMRQGSTQEVSGNKALDHLMFEEYSFDITDYFSSDDYIYFKTNERYLHELVFPNMALPEERAEHTKFLAEANARIANPLYNLTFAMLAVTAVLGGGFSRQGYGRRIAIATGVAVMTRIIGVVAESASQAAVLLNILQYVVPLVPVYICYMRLRRADVGGVRSVEKSANVLVPLGEPIGGSGR